MRKIKSLLILGAALGLGVFYLGTRVSADDHEHKGGDRHHGCCFAHVKGNYTFRFVPATSFKNSGTSTAPRQDILRVGTLQFDGKGNFTGSTIATTDDGTDTIIIDFTFSGTYTVNPDDTGYLTVSTVNVTDSSCTPAQAGGFCATLESPEEYAFVINESAGRTVLGLTEVDNAAGGPKMFLTGDAFPTTLRPCPAASPSPAPSPSPSSVPGD